MNEDKISFYDFLKLDYNFIKDPSMIVKTLEKMWKLPFGEVYEKGFSPRFSTPASGVYEQLQKDGLICCSFAEFCALPFGEVMRQVEEDMCRKYKESEDLQPMIDELWNIFLGLHALYARA